MDLSILRLRRPLWTPSRRSTACCWTRRRSLLAGRFNFYLWKVFKCVFLPDLFPARNARRSWERRLRSSPMSTSRTSERTWETRSWRKSSPSSGRSPLTKWWVLVVLYDLHLTWASGIIPWHDLHNQYLCVNVTQPKFKPAGLAGLAGLSGSWSGLSFQGHNTPAWSGTIGTSKHHHGCWIVKMHHFDNYHF